MIKFNVLLLILSLSSVCFVHCSENDEINQFSWDLFKFMALEDGNDNVVMNGFGPQLLLLEVMMGAKGKTFAEINDKAKSSSRDELLRYNEHFKVDKELKKFKTRIASFVSSTAKFDHNFLNQMLERNYEFRTTDFSKVNETNALLKPFYKDIDYNDIDNYPASTKMVLKSSSSLNLQISCSNLNLEQFGDHNNQNKVKMVKICDSTNGGTIKNDKGTVIANWAKIPVQYIKGHDISIVLVKPFELTVNDVLPHIKNLNFMMNNRNYNKYYSFMKFPLLLMAKVVSLNKYLAKMGISSMFSEKDANFTGITGTTDDNQIFVNDFTQTTSIDMDCDSKIENYYSCNELLKEAEGFVLDSQFIFIVFQNNTKTPLLIGKITDPYQAKPIPGKQTTCKIPNVENGFVVDSVLDEKIQSGSTVEVDVTQVLVKCNAGYDLQILERTQDRACTSYGWDGVFPKCQKMCQVNLLKSHSTVITCYKDTIQIDCGRSVGPGVSAKVSCKSRYQFEPNAKKEFVCQENGNWNGERTECKADCGQLVPKATALAAGAIEANSHGVPWYAGIYYNDNQICGGTIISELIVISAAHCFKIDSSNEVSEIVKSDYKVIVGKFYRDIDASEPDVTQTLMIKDVKIPNIYRGKVSKYQGDIAVLTLNEVIIYRNHIAPACLKMNAVGVREKQLPQYASLGLVAGFGHTDSGLPSEALRKIELPIVDFDICFALADYNFRTFLISDKFCAGYTDSTGFVCKSFSGGGLTFKDEQTKKYYVNGVVSNVNTLDGSDCDPHFYSVHTNVMDYIEMIREQHTASLNVLQDMIEHPKKKITTL